MVHDGLLNRIELAISLSALLPLDFLVSIRVNLAMRGYDDSQSHGCALPPVSLSIHLLIVDDKPDKFGLSRLYRETLRLADKN